jgi:hypothetical protein
MRTSGEGATYAVHTAQVLDARRVLEMAMVVRVKPIGEVLNKRYWIYHWKRRGCEVWRLRTLTARQRAALTRQALIYNNARFGWIRFSTHLLDGLISQITRKDVFFFRRLGHENRYPLCSDITANAYDKVLHYRFGVPPDCADPDQIHDWVKANPDEWVQVFHLDEV